MRTAGGQVSQDLGQDAVALRRRSSAAGEARFGSMHTGCVISLDLARRLKHAGVAWSPAPGDRFMIPDRDMDERVFAVSDMVVEVHDLPRGRLLAFNGTTEWALDSIMESDVVWLPSETQLRTMLGPAFVSLLAVPGGHVVVVDRGDQQSRYVDVDAACAYARAVLGLLADRSLPPGDVQ